MADMNTEEIKTMLTIDHIVWNALVCLLEKHPSGNLHEPGGSYPWTSRDIYAHFARWLDRSNAHIEAYCAGKKLPELPAAPEKMNDIWQQEDSVLTLAEARAKAMDAFARHLGIIEAIPLSRWDAELSKLVNYDGAAHYAMHINYIAVT
jgi:hypothetical protein